MLPDLRHEYGLVVAARAASALIRAANSRPAT